MVLPLLYSEIAHDRLRIHLCHAAQAGNIHPLVSTVHASARHAIPTYRWNTPGDKHPPVARWPTALAAELLPGDSFHTSGQAQDDLLLLRDLSRGDVCHGLELVGDVGMRFEATGQRMTNGFFGTPRQQAHITIRFARIRDHIDRTPPPD